MVPQIFVNAPWLLDLIVIALFVLFAVWRGIRGLYKSIVPLLSLVAAVVTAALLSPVLAKPVTERVYPKVEAAVMSHLSENFDSAELAAAFETAEEILGEDFPQILEQVLTQGSLEDVIAALPEEVRSVAESLPEILGEDLPQIVGQFLAQGSLEGVLTDEQIDAVKDALTDEQIDAVKDALTDEQIDAVKDALTDEQIDAVKDTLTDEQIDAVKDALTDEQIDAVKDALTDEQINAVKDALANGAAPAEVQSMTVFAAAPPEESGTAAEPSEETPEESGEPAADTAAALYAAVSALAHKITQAVVRVLLGLLIFILSLILFKLIFKLLGLATKLPVIRWVDRLGGIAVGLASCGLLLYVAGRTAAMCGLTVLHEMAEGTMLFSLFF